MSEPTFLEVVDEIFARWSMDAIDDAAFRAAVVKEVEFIIENGKE